MTSAADDTRVRLLPFRALRYRVDADRLADVTVAPPDHWDDAHLAQLMARHPHNVVHLLAPVLAGDGDASRAPEVGARLEGWLADGVVASDTEPAFYVYRYRHASRSLLGVIAGVGQGPGDTPVLPHENDIPDVVERQWSLLRATHAQLEPVLALHRGGLGTTPFLEQAATGEPDVRFVTEEGATHELWQLTDARAQADIARTLAGARLMIADGHHRHAALLRNADQSGPALVITLLVDADDGGLHLGPIHRVLPAPAHDLWTEVDGIPVPDLSAAVEHLEHRPANPARFVLTDGTRFVAGEAALGVAVSALHDAWLPAWGVDDATVQYVHDAGAALSLARRSHGIAVLLPSPTLDEVFAAASGDRLMPRKATSFGPKPRIGLVMRDLRQ